MVVHDVADCDGRPGSKLKKRVAKLLTTLTSDKPEVPAHWAAASVWQLAFGSNTAVLETKWPGCSVDFPGLGAGQKPPSV